MDSFDKVEINDRWISSLRRKKNQLDPKRPYAYLVEKERTASGAIEDFATLFLTNRECPFKCLMCDLWKNTTDYSISAGDIPEQIEWALNRLPRAQHIKLYNSGNFFDRKAIPVQDYNEIAVLVAGFQTVVVECHPKLINEDCLNFARLLKPNLEIAIGLETTNPDLLQKLNKRMNLNEFKKSVRFLRDHDISSRAFILLRPPFLSEKEGVFWAKQSIEFAFNAGVECCAVIPTRPGNGALDWLQAHQYFSPPTVYSLESVLEFGIELGTGRVFADLWDLELFSNCKECFDQRKDRLHEMNLKQVVLPPVECSCAI